MSIKINKLEIENVKRIKAVTLKPSQNGLTIIGGNNNQGKTSVIDAIAWALGGERFKPSQAEREGSAIPPTLHIVMNNGLIVERKGKNSTLKVTDPNGEKAGQQLLNDFVEQLALDLPKFMNSTGKEKADTLLRIIGVGDQLSVLEKKETELYNERLTIGQIADKKKKYAEEQVYYPEAPTDLISASELIRQQQDILAKNGENQRKRELVDQFKYKVSVLNSDIDALKSKLAEKQAELDKAAYDLSIAEKSAEDLVDESTEELAKNITQVEELNRKVRANMDKEKAEEDAKDYVNQYNDLSNKIAGVREQKTNLLVNASLPLQELSVAEGELVYKGQKWDNMSGSDQLKVATAIVRKLNPECGFVLLDKLEQMDLKTLTEFGEWLKNEDLQVIATRVSTGDECSIIIEDGYAIGQELKEESTTDKKEWKAGEF